MAVFRFQTGQASASLMIGIISPGTGQSCMNSNDFVAIEQPPLHATVYRLVRTNIESGRLPPGTSLTEHWLAQELSLSRMPVGRALQRLERDGLLVRDGARGFVVGGAPGLLAATVRSWIFRSSDIPLFSGAIGSRSSAGLVLPPPETPASLSPSLRGGVHFFATHLRTSPELAVGRPEAR
jgi:biotin operon repressor